MFDKKKQQPNETDNFKSQLLERISMLNNMILDVKNELEKNIGQIHSKISEIEKALNILDEDLFEISQNNNKKEDSIVPLTKNVSDLNLFAKLSLKNSDLIKEQKNEFELLNKKIAHIKKQIANSDVLIPAKKSLNKNKTQKKTQNKQ